MKKYITNGIKAAAFVLAFVIGSFAASAQNSMPAPGSGGSFRPNPSNGIGWNPGPGFGPANGIGWNPGPAYWGSPWYQGWNNSPTIVVSPSINTGNFQNQGITKVVACGYDATGVWRVLPMLVSYQYDGAQYDVNVLNAWNPWTDQWDKGLDVQAFNTNYILRNITYDYYAVLPFGTFYFNL